MSEWKKVCAVSEIIPDTGVCALVDGCQVAVFRVDGDVFALDNFDPFSRAYVLARGIVGDRDGVLKVASPMYKQSFCLRTGRCLDDDAVAVRTFPVREHEGFVEIAVPVAPPAAAAG